MRPVRLVVEGFTAFRERNEIDFEGADLFALVGPTGSGKSSIIDAVTFALYGQVSRYGDARLVAPVITQGAASATVDFTFDVGDDRYRVHREVSRRGRGATTREVRLERGDEVVAGDAAEASAAVTELLGLTFDQFTTCVVLPQGEFARFLHEKPKDRRALLVQLLDLGAYGELVTRANALAAEAAAKVEVLDGRLESLSELSGADLEALARRADGLASLDEDVRRSQPRLDALDAEVRVHVEAAEAAGRGAKLLADVVVPSSVREHVALLEEATRALADAERDEQAAEERLLTGEEARRALPERAALDLARQRYAERDQLTTRLTDGEARTEQTRTAEREAVVVLEAAEGAAETAAAALEAARREHTAHDLAERLQPGDACPVCHRTIDVAPSHDLTDLRERQQALEAARLAVVDARRARDAAGEERTRFEEQLRSLTERRDDVDRLLDGSPAPDDLAELEQRIDAADAAVVAARTARDAARDQRRATESKRRKAETLLKAHADDFAELRESLAELGPPRAERQRLVDDWEALAAWAASRRPELEHDADAARAAADRRTAERAAVADELARACTALDVDPTAADLGAAVAAARLEAERARDRVRDAREQTAEVRADRDALAESASVSRLLGRLLRSDGFQQWLLDEAVDALVAGATERLRALSDGRYSLTVDDKGDFQVVDHFNADEVRIARTLSGGETFLASLALALALSDQIGELAADGAPRLESIFLDEGFGTLDPETLDVVIDAIETLGSTGRVVGLVSHVGDLAERVPVRFVVRKGPATATVERIDQ